MDVERSRTDIGELGWKILILVTQGRLKPKEAKSIIESLHYRNAASQRAGSWGKDLSSREKQEKQLAQLHVGWENWWSNLSKEEQELFMEHLRSGKK